jgi:hypothetical protein
MHSHDIVSSSTGGTRKYHGGDDGVRDEVLDEKAVMYDTHPGILVAE